MISKNENRRIMSNPKAKLFCVLSLISLISLLISGTLPALAQETTSGAAAGKVYDIANNQGIAGARVQVTNKETGSQRYFTTRADGSYTATALISGIYSITASSPDYENIPNSHLSDILEFRVDLAKTRQAEFPPIALQKRGAAA